MAWGGPAAPDRMHWTSAFVVVVLLWLIPSGFAQEFACPAGQAWGAHSNACEVCDEVAQERQCQPGHEFNATAGGCTQCLEGKQSPGMGRPCSYCRFTMRPTAARDDCECDELTFNMRNDTRGNPDVGCTSCAQVQVARIDGTTENCDPTADLQQEGSSQCECVGGPKGAASLCAREGFWVDRGSGADDELPRLRQCISLRTTVASKCQHWSKCIGEEFNIGERKKNGDPCA
eukprot:COSAG02_NODE_1061_length_14864_cov_7.878090_4_plen_232_part_00